VFQNIISYRLLFLTTVILGLSAFYIGNPQFEKVVKRLDHLIYNFPQEKVYVMTDKPHYIMGDTIWFSVKATDAALHERNAVSNLVYVQLVDENSIIKTKLKVPVSDKNGKGYIPLDYELQEGSYSIQAYSSYMLNYDANYIFSKELKIWKAGTVAQNTDLKNINNPTSENLNIRFFPEGGQLIDGIETVVAFEGLSGQGLPQDFSISIKDVEGNPVAQSKTLHDGMGIFILKPQLGKKYIVEVNNQKYELPEIQATGYGMRVLNRNNENFSVTLNTNIQGGLDGSFLVCHTRGEVFFTKDGLSGNSVTIKIDKNDISSGVAQVTLFNKEGVPVAERAIFVNNLKEVPIVKVEMPYAYQNPRSKAEVSCLISDPSGIPLKSEYSVSVIDANEVHYSPNDLDIKSFFLLNSDLTRTLRHPGFYFTENSAKNVMLLDIAMMVHGYTRIKSDKLMDETDPPIIYGPEQGVTISGTVYKDDKPLRNAKVDISILEGALYADQISTNAKGRFAFYNVPAYKGQTIFLRAYEETKKGKKMESSDKVVLEMDQDKDIQVLAGYTNRISWQKDFNPYDFLMTSLEKNRNDSLYTAMSVQLDQVTIKVSRTKRDAIIAKERGIIYPRYDSRVFMDSLKFFNPSWTVFDFVVNTTPGAELVGRERGNPSIRFRGGLNSLGTVRPAVFYLDGVPISSTVVSTIDINTVDFIDVLRGLPATTMYGNDGMGGIVHIYSRLKSAQPQKRDKKKNVAKYIAEGFHEAREFYSPDYGAKNQITGKPDVRTTLYWSPLVQSDNEGKSSFSFYTSDKKSKYIINIQGMTKDGRPFTGYGFFEVKSSL
jgi:hypothetical protein